MSVSRWILLVGVVAIATLISSCLVGASDPSERKVTTKHLRRGQTTQSHNTRGLQASGGGLNLLSFDLINANTDSKIATLTNNQVIVVSSIPGMSTLAFNLDVNYSGADIKSVVFTSTTTIPNFKNENTPRWAYCGNAGADFYACPGLGYGTHTITATPYSAISGGGTKGTPISITFTIVQTAPMNPPVKPPTGTPVVKLTKAPTIAPNKPPTKSPLKPPMNAPLKPPTKAPIKPPSKAPLKPPTKAPLKPPTKAPTLMATKPPTNAPINPPTKAPSSNAPIPLPFPILAGTAWAPALDYPHNIAEAHGAFVGSTLLIFSGFFYNWDQTTDLVYGLDTSNPSATWQQMDTIPVPGGITHAGLAVVGSKVYFCGNYELEYADLCFVYDHSKALGQKWSNMTKLPEGRGGGGLVYDTELNALVFSGGAQKIPGVEGFQTDYDTTWMYSFNNSQAGWVVKAPIPYLGNHISHVTATDQFGLEHHYYFGGQEKFFEANGNHDVIYEYVASNDTWIQRRNLPFPRGHATSSTRPFGNGFIVAGGCTNGGNKVIDVTYYDIPTNTWTKLGDLPWGLNTPVCDIDRISNTLYCETGFVYGKYSYKRQLLLQ